jgi:chromosome segregation ATPase
VDLHGQIKNLQTQIEQRDELLRDSRAEVATYVKQAGQLEAANNTITKLEAKVETFQGLTGRLDDRNETIGKLKAEVCCLPLNDGHEFIDHEFAGREA